MEARNKKWEQVRVTYAIGGDAWTETIDVFVDKTNKRNMEEEISWKLSRMYRDKNIDILKFKVM